MEETRAKTRTTLGQLKEVDLREILEDLLCDHVNFSALQCSHIATVINKRLSGTANNEVAHAPDKSGDVTGNAGIMNSDTVSTEWSSVSWSRMRERCPFG